MIRYAGDVNRQAWIRKYFYGIAGFKIVLAGAGFARVLPRGNLIIDERIIERSEISWLSAVTSWKRVKTPGEIQLAKANSSVILGTPESVKNV